MTTTEHALPTTTTRTLTAARAIAEGIAQEMAHDDNVFVLGEDVGEYGGTFGTTGGLRQQFGPHRVLDTPLSETAFVGLGVGAAMEGMRPVVELKSVDQIGACLDQIYNQLAKIHYVSGGNIRVPMVLSAPVGAGFSEGAQHSQCLWGTFAHLPGLKVVVPSNPADAKGLMISAIRDDDPVVYLFHKGLLGWPELGATEPPRAVPTEPYTVPLGRAVVAREGTDVTLVTLSLSVRHALDAAEEMAAHGVHVEVIDLRSLVPLDAMTVLDSVRKTGRLVVVDEDYRSFGLSGEIAALVAESDPGMLRAPMSRVAVPDVPIPYARELEQAVLPRGARITDAIREVRG